MAANEQCLNLHVCVLPTVTQAGHEDAMHCVRLVGATHCATDADVISIA